MAQEVGENTQIRANLAFVGKTIGIVGASVWFYSSMVADIQSINVDLMRIHHEVDMNS